MSEHLSRPESVKENAADRQEWIEFVCIQLADEFYKFELGRITQIIRDPAVTPVPRTGAAIAGVTTLGGEIAVVIDGRALLDLPDRPENTDAVLLLLDRNSSQQTGFLVDHVPGIDPHHINHITSPADRDEWHPPIDDWWLRAVIEEPDRTDHPIGVLDVNAIITEARDQA